MSRMADDDGDGGQHSWLTGPGGRIGAVILMLLGTMFGGYKLIDSAVERNIKDNTAQIVAVASKVDGISKRLDEFEVEFRKLQADRLLDLRTVFERGAALQGSLDTLNRQLVDVKQSMEANERRTSDSDRDIKQSIGELRGEVNHALRAPLVGPQRR